MESAPQQEPIVWEIPQQTFKMNGRDIRVLNIKWFVGQDGTGQVQFHIPQFLGETATLPITGAPQEARRQGIEVLRMIATHLRQNEDLLPPIDSDDPVEQIAAIMEQIAQRAGNSTPAPAAAVSSAAPSAPTNAPSLTPEKAIEQMAPDLRPAIETLIDFFDCATPVFEKIESQNPHYGSPKIPPVNFGPSGNGSWQRLRDGISINYRTPDDASNVDWTNINILRRTWRKDSESLILVCEGLKRETAQWGAIQFERHYTPQKEGHFAINIERSISNGEITSVTIIHPMLFSWPTQENPVFNTTVGSEPYNLEVDTEPSPIKMPFHPRFMQQVLNDLWPKLAPKLQAEAQAAIQKIINVLPGADRRTIKNSAPDMWLDIDETLATSGCSETVRPGTLTDLSPRQQDLLCRAVQMKMKRPENIPTIKDPQSAIDIAKSNGFELCVFEAAGSANPRVCLVQTAQLPKINVLGVAGLTEVDSIGGSLYWWVHDRLEREKRHSWIHPASRAGLTRDETEEFLANFWLKEDRPNMGRARLPYLQEFLLLAKESDGRIGREGVFEWLDGGALRTSPSFCGVKGNKSVAVQNARDDDAFTNVVFRVVIELPAK